MPSAVAAGRKGYAEEQANPWLTWLARGLQEHGESLFLMERLQPSWLGTRGELRKYVVLTRLATGLLLGCVLALVLAPSSGLRVGLMVGLAAGFVLGIASSMVDLHRFRDGGLWVRMIRHLESRYSTRWRGRARSVYYYLIVAILSVVVCLLGANAISEAEGEMQRSALLLPFAALAGAVLASILNGPGSLRRDIRTVETLRWSWPHATKGALLGLACGGLWPVLFSSVVGLTFVGAIGLVVVGFALVLGKAGKYALRMGIFSFLSSIRGRIILLFLFFLSLLVLAYGENALDLGRVGILSFMELATYGWAAWVLPGVLGALVGLVFGGLRSRVVDTKTAPNQGMRLSLRNAALAGGSFVLTAAALSWPALVLLEGPQTPQGPEGLVAASLNWSRWAVPALQLNLGFGLFAGLWYGGVDFVSHHVLRFLLRRRIPWRLGPFLDYATQDLRFLRQAGGGYQFIHRYLLEHFAQMGLEEVELRSPKPEVPDGVPVATSLENFERLRQMLESTGAVSRGRPAEAEASVVEMLPTEQLQWAAEQVQWIDVGTRCEVVSREDEVAEVLVLEGEAAGERCYVDPLFLRPSQAFLQSAAGGDVPVLARSLGEDGEVEIDPAGEETWPVADGTACEVIGFRDGYYEIRISEGARGGSTGLVTPDRLARIRSSFGAPGETTDVPVARSLEDLREFQAKEDAEDDQGIAALIESGGVWLVSEGTRCDVLDRKDDEPRVRILDGEWAGSICYVMEGLLATAEAETADRLA